MGPHTLASFLSTQAQAEGFFAEQGLTVFYNQVLGSPAQFAALYAGTYQIVSTTTGDALSWPQPACMRHEHRHTARARCASMALLICACLVVVRRQQYQPLCEWRAGESGGAGEPQLAKGADRGGRRAGASWSSCCCTPLNTNTLR
jgi:hypothetical protein